MLIQLNDPKRGPITAREFDYIDQRGSRSPINRGDLINEIKKASPELFQGGRQVAALVSEKTEALIVEQRFAKCCHHCSHQNDYDQHKQLLLEWDVHVIPCKNCPEGVIYLLGYHSDNALDLDTIRKLELTDG